MQSYSKEKIPTEKMRLLLYGGQFDPVHHGHMQILKAAIAQLNVDFVKVIPQYFSQQKRTGFATFESRIAMLRLALQEYAINAEIDRIEKDIHQNGYSIYMIEKIQSLYPQATLFFLIGADQFATLEKWFQFEKILKKVTFVVAGRASSTLSKKSVQQFEKKYNCQILLLECVGQAISSTEIQCNLAFQKSIANFLPKTVNAYIQENLSAVYLPVVLQNGMQFLTPQRKEHSLRVAKMALKIADKYQLDRKKILLAAALHDVAKTLEKDNAIIQQLNLAEIPVAYGSPVWHAFAGACLLQQYLKIQDKEIIDAVAYHSTGRANMTTLEKIIYLADLLEKERNFENIAFLRQLYYNDIDKCLAYSLQYTIKYLQKKGIEIHPYTIHAYNFYKKYLGDNDDEKKENIRRDDK